MYVCILEFTGLTFCTFHMQSLYFCTLEFVFILHFELEFDNFGLPYLDVYIKVGKLPLFCHGKILRDFSLGLIMGRFTCLLP